MPAKKYLSLDNGRIREVQATVASSGAADDGKIVALDATGRIDSSALPNTIIANSNVVIRGDLVEGGQLVLGYKNNTSAVGEGASTWNIDVNGANNLRIFKRDVNGYPSILLVLSEATANIYPGSDNAEDLGIASNRWKTIYAATGTINTSDAREKTEVRPLTDSELAAAKALSREIGAYRFLSSIAEKGDLAREHIGLTVQRAIEIMRDHGLDPFGYGFICYDKWDAEAVANPDGSQYVREAGDRYSFRVDELLLFVCRGLEARLAAIEDGAA